MTTLLARIAPQRSTQYADLAAALAPHELRLSPLGRRIVDLAPLTLGGQDYLRVELDGELDERLAAELGALASLSGYYLYYEAVGGQAGPWLRPVETPFQPRLPQEIIYARRYRGKTNEMLTQFLCNVARHSSAYAAEPWASLRVVDPLAGGGTTLLTALVLGADVAGVEKDPQDVESTVTFIRQFAREAGIPCQVQPEHLRGVGRRWWVRIGREPRQDCVLALGDTAAVPELLRAFKPPHLVVTDLPYGIQHRGEVTGLLRAALPVWTALLLPGGALAMAWDATRFPRADMVALVGGQEGLEVLDEPPYDALGHRVDRVIKRRDVLVARRTA